MKVKTYLIILSVSCIYVLFQQRNREGDPTDVTQSTRISVYVPHRDVCPLADVADLGHSEMVQTKRHLSAVSNPTDRSTSINEGDAYIAEMNIHTYLISLFVLRLYAFFQPNNPETAGNDGSPTSHYTILMAHRDERPLVNDPDGPGISHTPMVRTEYHNSTEWHRVDPHMPTKGADACRARLLSNNAYVYAVMFLLYAPVCLLLMQLIYGLSYYICTSVCITPCNLCDNYHLDPDLISESIELNIGLTFDIIVLCLVGKKRT